MKKYVTDKDSLCLLYSYGQRYKNIFFLAAAVCTLCQCSPRDFRRYSPVTDRARSDAIDITGSSVIGSLFCISHYVDLLYCSTLERPNCVYNATTSGVTTTVFPLCFVETVNNTFIQFVVSVAEAGPLCSSLSVTCA